MGVVSNILDSDQRRALLCNVLHPSDSSHNFPNNFSPLHFVVYFDLPGMIWRSSGGRGIDPTEADLCDSWGRTPLHIAYQRASIEHMAVMGRSHVEPPESGADLIQHQDVPSGQQHDQTGQQRPPMTNICKSWLNSPGKYRPRFRMRRTK